MKRKIAARRPRADAKRNRERLLEAAMAVFGKKGAHASLEEIARAAGVGIGTLYRHFPTREALIEAVYANEVDQLVRAADRLAKSRAPLEALREWMRMFVDYMAAKHGMAEVLKSIAGTATYASSGTQMKDAITMLAGRAVESGDIHLNVEPLDLLRALYGVTGSSAGAEPRRAAKRVVDILIQGVRK